MIALFDKSFEKFTNDLSTEAKIPSTLIAPFLGKVFEQWLNQKGISENKYREKPTFFASSNLNLLKKSRQADGYDGTTLLDAKLNLKGEEGRPCKTEDEDQMKDYFLIIKSPEVWTNDKDKEISFNSIRYQFNDIETAKKWFGNPESEPRTILEDTWRDPLVGNKPAGII